MFYFSLVDVDECETNTDNCAQNCLNTIGSFQCSCYDGFQILEDGSGTCTSE